MQWLDRVELYAQAAHQWGIPSQVNMAIEEQAENIKILNKTLRQGIGVTYHQLVDEIADVKITQEQVRFMFQVADADVDRVISLKLRRLEGLLKQFPRVSSP